MAEAIYNYLMINKKNSVIHFNGDFHSRSYMGTVQKLKDRDPKLRIAVIFPQYTEKGFGIKFNALVKSGGDYQLILDYKEQEPTNEMMMGGHLSMNGIEKHDITLKLDPTQHTVSGTDTLWFKNPIIRKANITLMKDLNVTSVTTPDGTITYEVVTENNEKQVLISTGGSKEIYKIVVVYNGTVYNKPDERALNQKHATSSGIISDSPNEGIYLPAGSFYPYSSQDLATFRVEVSFPEDFEVITSGKVNKRPADMGIKTYVFKSELPTDQLTLVGGKYQLIKDTVYDGKSFIVYAYNKEVPASSYLKASVDYYKFYTNLFGPYPYSSFAIVENFFATGYGMPGYTLLSNQLMKMPWIVLAPGALAHEFVHNWWGNSVYVYPDRENWCEGLTSFSTNYYYHVLTNNTKKMKEWRMSALVSLATLPAKDNYPLKNFKYQETDEDAVIGYQKSGFLFYELYKVMGKEHFFGALKSFAANYQGKRALWFSLNFSFQQYAKKNNLNIPINRMFNQYVNPTRLPSVKLAGIFMKGDSCYFTIEQDTAFYTMVPVRVITDKDTFWKDCLAYKQRTPFSVPRANNIRSIEADPDYHVLRKLYSWEIPVTFKENLNSNPVVVLPSKSHPDYQPCKDYVDMLNKTGYKLTAVAADELNEGLLMGKSLIVMGTPASNPYMLKLAGTYPAEFTLNKDFLSFNGKNYPLKDQLLMVNYLPKGKPNQYYTILYAANVGTAELFRRFSHYSGYSIVLVAQARGSQAVIQDHLFPDKQAVNQLQYRFLK
jgi:hypothetical protein